MKISKAQKRDNLRKIKRFRKDRPKDSLLQKKFQRGKAVSIRKNRKIKERLTETENASV